MTWWEREPEAVNCRVVVNEEEQYALWPTETPLPVGWRDTGFAGTAAACGEYVGRVWTDMRPRSVRDSDGDLTGPPGSA
jgi:MbtH protein